MALQLNNIVKFYRYGKNQQVVINDLTIKFPSYGLVGIIGKSGSGKSTLLNIIAGIEKPNSGTVQIDGHPLDYRQITEYRRNYISYVYQFYNLVEALSIKQNLVILAKIKGVSTKQLVARMDYYCRWLKIDSLLDSYPSELSGGEKQRVDLIRAFLCDTPILLADEPTGALNESLSVEVLRLLKKYARNHLVIIISHNQQLIMQYTKMIVDLDLEQNQYIFNNNRYHKYLFSAIKKQSARLFFYVRQQLRYQKKKIFMLFISQIFIILAFVLLLSACNGGWLFIEKRVSSNPLKEVIEVSKNDYFDAAFNEKDIELLKQNPKIIKIKYKLNFDYGKFRNAQEMNLTTYQIFSTKNLIYQKGSYPQKENQILINEAATKYKLSIGEVINFKINDLKQNFTVSGIIEDHVNQGENIYFNENYLNLDLINALQVKEVLIITSNHVESLLKQYQNDYLLLSYHQEYLDNYQTIFELAKLVALLFISISLFISVILISIILKTIFIERKRDTSLLLANGLKKGTAVRLFCHEAMLIGGIIGGVGGMFSMFVLKVFELIELSGRLFGIPNLFVLPQYFYSKYDLYFLLLLIYVGSCYLAAIQASYKISKMDISILLKED